jgi:Tol biopolymer transport system component
VPAEFDRVVTRAMAKNPDERIQSMKDLALELRDIASTFDSLRVQTRARRRAKSTRSVVALIVIPAIIAAAAGYLLHRPKPITQPLRFAIAPPENATFTSTSNSASALQFALSPKGNVIAFVAARDGGPPMVFLRDFASVDGHPIAGTEGAYFPFWSPETDAIGFFADGKLKRISIAGGPPVVLADALDPRGGSWSRDGTIVFSAGTVGPLLRVPATGGEVTPALKLDRPRHERSQRWPFFLPDGKRFIYLSLNGDAVPRAIYQGELGSDSVRQVIKADGSAQFVAPDELFFVRKGSLYSQRLDPDTLAAKAQALLVERDIGFAPSIQYASFSAASDGVLAYAPWVNPNRRLMWIDRHGKELAAASEPADWGASFISLRGDHAILNRTEPDTGNLDLWDIDLTRGVGSKITTDENDDNHGLLSPDGGALVYTSNRAGAFDVYMRKGKSDSKLVTSEGGVALTDWTLDGRFVIYHDRGRSTQADIWMLPVTEGGPPRAFQKTRFYEGYATVSPDGHWIAYQSDESGRIEVYVQPFPAGGKTVRVSVDGGFEPKWSADGREIVFLTHNSEFVSARVKPSGEDFRCDLPATLFRIPGVVPAAPAFFPWYALAPDGRFLMVITPTDHPTAAITVAMNSRN